MRATRSPTKPTKQRKMLYQAPDHTRHKLLAAHLSPELRTSYGVKNVPVRSGDTIHVMRGDHRGVEGKITRVDLSKYRIYVEGLTREKVDGSTVFVPIHPSKVMVKRLNLDDKWRKEVLETKKEGRKRLEKAAEKPKVKPEAKLEEKPKEVAEVKKVIEEKAALKEKAPKKKVSRARKRAPKKMQIEKAKPEIEKAEKEEKPKPKKRTRRASRKTAKKAEEGEE
jgi:large subunit ribosomal protein L24